MLLVAAADPDLCGEVPSFQLDLNSTQVKAAAHSAALMTLFVGSDSDPWQPRGVENTFAKPLDLPFVVIPGAGHFAVEEGWTPWAGVISWVTDSTADLATR